MSSLMERIQSCTATSKSFLLLLLAGPILVLLLFPVGVAADAALPDESAINLSIPATGIVYVLRHGEKIPSGNHLNRTGQLRARHVADLFSGERAKYASPKAIFANFFHNEHNSVELGTPLARRLGLEVNSSYHRPLYGEDNTAAAAAILTTLLNTGGPVMAIWESWNLVPLVRDLGCSRPWLANYSGELWGHFANANTSYDRFFILHLKGGNCTSLVMTREYFNSGATWPAHPPRSVPEAPPFFLGDSSPLLFFMGGLLVASMSLAALRCRRNRKCCCLAACPVGLDPGHASPRSAGPSSPLLRS